MALIACRECGGEISDQAMSCPKCGVRLRRRRWPWVVAGGVILVAAVGAGAYLVMQHQEQQRIRAEAAALVAAQDDAWKASTERAVAEGQGYVKLSGDGNSVHVVSDRLATCSQGEIDAAYWELMEGYTNLYGADMAVTLYGSTAQIEASSACRAGKTGDFNESVTKSKAWVVALLDSIGAPDNAVSQIEGLRGLDGTSEFELNSDAGPLVMQARYDGSNGLDVVVIRD